MKKQSMFMIVGVAIFVGIILIASNTVSMQSIVPQATAPVSTAPGKPIITLDKTTYAESSTVTMKITCDANPKAATLKASTITNFRVSISGNGFFPSLLVFKATKTTGTNTYTGIAQFKIPIGSNTMTVSVTAIDAAGRVGASAVKILTRSSTFTEITPKPIPV